MEAFEKPEDLVLIFGLDPNAVVGYRESPPAILTFHSYMHDRRPIRTAVFDGVPDQILEQLLQVYAMYAKRRQPVECDPGASFGDHASQACQSRLDRFAGIGGLHRLLEFCDLGIAEEIPHQHFHAGCAAAYKGQKFTGFARKRVDAAVLQKLAIDFDAA